MHYFANMQGNGMFGCYYNVQNVIYVLLSRAKVGISEKTPDALDFLLEHKMFHKNLCVFIIISALLYLLLLLSLHKSLFYPPFIYILYYV